MPSTSALALHACGADAAEEQLVPGDDEAGRLLHAGDDAAHRAARDLPHHAAALAAHVLVVVARGLVALLAVPQLHAPHDALVLQPRQRAEDRREVGPHAAAAERRDEVLDRP